MHGILSKWRYVAPLRRDPKRGYALGMGHVRLLALLVGLCGGASAAEPPLDADVEPQVLRSSVTWPDPSYPYYRRDDRFERVRAMTAPGRDAYPRVVDGALLPPKLYDVEKRYTPADQERLKKALLAAKRYADVNAAVDDGYRFEQKFEPGMGIHAHRLDLIFGGVLDPAKPQFLTYSIDRVTGRWQLIQLGYIRRGLTRPDFFDSPNARGHFHDENICVALTGVQLAARFAGEPCDRPDERRVGPIWMMHVAVPLYNEEGLFADEFPYADHLSWAGEGYSFFGRKVPGGKP